MEKMEFVRINKCYLVNLEHVDGVKRNMPLFTGRIF